MTILLLVLGIAALITGVVIYYNGNFRSADEEIIGITTGAIGGCVAIVSLIAVLILGVEVSNLSVIDEKIAMYQEENTKIEEQIVDVVEGYQKYETDIFEKVTPESAVTLVSLYPELKSDTLVQSQIEVYINNNNYIKTLKEDKINGDVYRWWLYFGGRDK